MTLGRECGEETKVARIIAREMNCGRKEAHKIQRRQVLSRTQGSGDVKVRPNFGWVSFFTLNLELLLESNKSALGAAMLSHSDVEDDI